MQNERSDLQLQTLSRPPRYPGRSTRKNYMSDLAVFHRFVGDVFPQAVTANTIDEFVQVQSEQGLKATTVN